MWHSQPWPKTRVFVLFFSVHILLCQSLPRTLSSFSDVIPDYTFRVHLEYFYTMAKICQQGDHIQLCDSQVPFRPVYSQGTIVEKVSHHFS